MLPGQAAGSRPRTESRRTDLRAVAVGVRARRAIPRSNAAYAACAEYCSAQLLQCSLQCLYNSLYVLSCEVKFLVFYVCVVIVGVSAKCAEAWLLDSEGLRMPVRSYASGLPVGLFTPAAVKFACVTCAS